MTEVLSDEHSITLVMTMTRPSAPCALCRHCSGCNHISCMRKVADVPWGGVQLKIRVCVRRFCCDNPDSDWCIFVERLPSARASYTRRTSRLQALLEAFGLALGGEAGVLLSRR